MGRATRSVMRYLLEFLLEVGMKEKGDKSTPFLLAECVYASRLLLEDQVAPICTVMSTTSTRKECRKKSASSSLQMLFDWPSTEMEVREVVSEWPPLIKMAFTDKPSSTTNSHSCDRALVRISLVLGWRHHLELFPSYIEKFITYTRTEFYYNTPLDINAISFQFICLRH